MASKAWNLVKENIENGNIREWCRTMTEEQIALSCGVSYSSFQNFKKKYKELEQELIQGKKLLCTDLKSALIKKALGYDYEEVMTHIIENANGTKKKEIKKTTKHFPPDTGAIHLLLKNNDDSWHNDDATQIRLRELEIELRKGQEEMQEDDFYGTEYLKDAFEQLLEVGEENEQE